MDRQSPILTTQESLRYRAETELGSCAMQHDTHIWPPPGLWPPIDYRAGENGECPKHLPG